jgi:dTDP-4-amino-4,6-dideoxygalactose transaminase
MLVPFVDLKKQYKEIESEVSDSVLSVFESSNFILGDNVSNFEKEFCEYLGGGFGVSVNSGTDALYLSLLACGVSKGDEVITVSHTFIATYMAIVQTGAKPVFVDIDPATFNIDTDKIEEKITDRTKALLPVHLYGHPADMDKITKLANRFDLYVIEDACQSHGSRIGNRKNRPFWRLCLFQLLSNKESGGLWGWRFCGCQG